MDKEWTTICHKPPLSSLKAKQPHRCQCRNAGQQALQGRQLGGVLQLPSLHLSMDGWEAACSWIAQAHNGSMPRLCCAPTASVLLQQAAFLSEWHCLATSPGSHATRLLVGCPQLLRSGDRAQQARKLRLALGQVQVGAPHAVVHQLVGERGRYSTGQAVG